MVAYQSSLSKLGLRKYQSTRNKGPNKSNILRRKQMKMSVMIVKRPILAVLRKRTQITISKKPGKEQTPGLFTKAHLKTTTWLETTVKRIAKSLILC
jgi:hypothetical protein